MKTTNAYAISVYGPRLIDRDDEQREFTVRTILEGLNENALIAAVDAVSIDLRRKYHRCVGGGLVDVASKPANEFSAVTVPGFHGLSVRQAVGDHLLFVWGKQSLKLTVSVFNWRDEKSEVAPTNPYDLDGGLQLSQVLAKISAHGPKGAAMVCGIGCVERTGLPFGLNKCRAYLGPQPVTRYAERIFSKLSARGNGRSDASKPFFDALAAGNFGEFAISILGLAVERIIASNIPVVREFVGVSDTLGLSQELVFAHSDTDIIAYGYRVGDRDVYAHSNIDQSECVYLTVLTHRGGDLAVLDLYMAERWGGGSAGFSEEMLIAAISSGNLPVEGRVLSYDFRTKTVDASVPLSSLGFIAMFPDIVQRDLASLKSALIDDFHGSGFEFQVRPIGGSTETIEFVDVHDYLTARARSPV
jgi:hypothetical protein